MQLNGATESRWQRLHKIAEQCQNIMHLSSAYYNQNYGEKQVALEVVADYFAVRNILLKDDPELLEFSGPKMAQFYEKLLEDAARQREVIRQKHAAEITAPVAVTQTLWNTDLPQKFSAKISEPLDPVQHR